MPLHYILDGYNIINNRLFPPFNKHPANPRIGILRLIRDKNLTGSLKNKATIVFDGYPDRELKNLCMGNISIIFSEESSADDKIKKIVETAVRPQDMIVVSDDKEIKFYARLHKSAALAVEEFLSFAKEKKSAKDESVKQELNYSQIDKINQELSRIWLK